MDDKIIWEGSPSQWGNSKVFLYCILMMLAVAIATINASSKWVGVLALYPLGRFLFTWYETYVEVYQLTDKKLLYRSGVFNKLTSSIELSRVKSVALHTSWEIRIWHLSNIKLELSQRNSEVFWIRSIKKAAIVQELIQNRIT